MRESDECFYIAPQLDEFDYVFLAPQRSATTVGFQVLTIQSCKRGLPLVPLVTDELPTTTIVAGVCENTPASLSGVEQILESLKLQALFARFRLLR